MAEPRLDERTSIALLPTPIRHLPRLSAALRLRTGSNARIWIKRDDTTGLADGGNKARKLEYLVHDALRAEATVLVTAGATQSNHARQTAAAAAMVGMRSVLVLAQGALDDADYMTSGNVLLDRILGATIRSYPAGTDLAAAMGAVVAELLADGERPYVVPVGGSNAVGSLGYVRCADEVLGHEQAFDALVVASGSGGTHAGLLAGFARDEERAPVVIGVCIADPPEVQGPKVTALVAAVRELLGGPASVAGPASASGPAGAAGEVVVLGDHVGQAYGIPTDGMRDAVDLVARTEGILLDPVYTGKAMAGLIAELAPGRLLHDRADVLFLHTGGQAGLFAYRSTFERPDKENVA